MNNVLQIVWLIPLLPLVGFLITGLFRNNLSKGASGFIASAAILGSFALSLFVFFQVKAGNTHVAHYFNLFKIESLTVPFEFKIDQLSTLFLLIITGVGFLIHVYSTSYMHDEDSKDFSKYFSYLNLFVFSMLLLVMGGNYVIMFFGWEGVGLCSYLLIGYWFKNNDYTNAAKKAFIMNRIGDLGFLLGLFWLISVIGTVSYDEVFSATSLERLSTTDITGITLLFFVGACGKSAQIPLYTWLPDAMAGPTPVSALIHAATMVTAGIYMIARSNVLYTMAPATQNVVAIIGLTTAIVAATIAIKQNDIKKVLAYSTVSQLGYMFLGLGVGAYTGAVFHVMTHAFFKALLFLGAGSVIHAMSGEQDIRSMGGLKKHLPITHITFLLGTLAIAGCPPFSGFFSKDEILAHAFEHNKLLWFIGVAGAAMTTFYMFRLYFLTFSGGFRGTKHQLEHLHESPKSMTIPLIVLAVLSVVGGFIGIPEVLGGKHFLDAFLKPVFEQSSFRISHHLLHSTEYTLMAIAVGVMAISLYYAYTVYVKQKALPVAEDKQLKPLHNLVYKKYMIDELYDFTITKPLNFISSGLHKVIDNQIVDGVVNGVGFVVNWTSSQIRLVQTGNIGLYIFIMVISIVIILFTRMM